MTTWVRESKKSDGGKDSLSAHIIESLDSNLSDDNNNNNNNDNNNNNTEIKKRVSIVDFDKSTLTGLGGGDNNKSNHTTTTNNKSKNNGNKDNNNDEDDEDNNNTRQKSPMQFLSPSTGTTTSLLIQPHNAAKVIKGEIHNVLTVMRADIRYASTLRFVEEEMAYEDAEHPLLTNLRDLHTALCDWEEDNSKYLHVQPDALLYVPPFCEAIKGREISASVTGAALSALHKFLLYGFILPDSPSAEEGMTLIANSLLSCTFEEQAGGNNNSDGTGAGGSSTVPGSSHHSQYHQYQSQYNKPVGGGGGGGVAATTGSKRSVVAIMMNDDEQVVLKLLELSALVVRCSLLSTPLIPTELVVGLLDTCLHVSHRAKRASPLLKSAAADALGQIVLQVFAGSGELLLKARAQILAKLASLLNPQQHSDAYCATSLTLVNIAFETCRENLTQHEITILQNDLCKYLSLWSMTHDLVILSLTLRVIFNLFQSIRNHLKVPLEVFLTSVHLRILDPNSSASNEEREVALESLLEFCQEPALMQDIYFNYDCDVQCTNLFEAVCLALARSSTFYDQASALGQAFQAAANAAVQYQLQKRQNNFDSNNPHGQGEGNSTIGNSSRPPTSGGVIGGQHLNEMSMSSVSTMSHSGSHLRSAATGANILNQQFHNHIIHYNTVSTGVILSTGPHIPLNVLNRLALEGFTAILDSIGRRCKAQIEYEQNLMESDSITDDGLRSEDGSYDSRWLAPVDESQEQLQRRKRKKQGFSRVANAFNDDPVKSNWIQIAFDEKLIQNKTDPVEIAEMLYTAPGLDKVQIGIYVSKGPEDKYVFIKKVRHAFCKRFDFSDLSFSTALRKFLNKFRLPGEAQCIDRLLDCFANELYRQLKEQSDKRAAVKEGQKKGTTTEGEGVEGEGGESTKDETDDTDKNNTTVVVVDDDDDDDEQQEDSVFKSADAVFVLAYSTIMLNTDLHNPSLKNENRMTLEQFIRNNRGINDGEDIPKEYLTELYNQIKHKEIKLRTGLGDFLSRNSMASVFGSQRGFGAGGGGARGDSQAPGSSANHNNTNSGGGNHRSAAPNRDLARYADDFRSSWDILVKQKATEVETAVFTDTQYARKSTIRAGIHDREMFVVLSKSALQCFTSILARSWDDTLIYKALEGIKNIIRMSDFFQVDNALNDTIIPLLGFGRDYIMGCVALEYAGYDNGAPIFTNGRLHLLPEDGDGVGGSAGSAGAGGATTVNTVSTASSMHSLDRSGNGTKSGGTGGEDNESHMIDKDSPLPLHLLVSNKEDNESMITADDWIQDDNKTKKNKQTGGRKPRPTLQRSGGIPLSNNRRSSKNSNGHLAGCSAYRGLLALDLGFVLVQRNAEKIKEAWPAYIECICALRDARGLPAGLSDLDDFADSNGNVLPQSLFAQKSQKRLDDYYKSIYHREDKKKGWFQKGGLAKTFGFGWGASSSAAPAPKSKVMGNASDNSRDNHKGSSGSTTGTAADTDDAISVASSVQDGGAMAGPNSQKELSTFSKTLLEVAENAEVEKVVQMGSTKLPASEHTIRALLDVVDEFPYEDDPVLEQHAIFSLELAARALLLNREKSSELFTLFLSKFESILSRVDDHCIPAPFVVERVVVTVLRSSIHLYDLPDLRPNLRASLHLLMMALPRSFIRQISDRMACGIAIILRASFHHFETVNEWAFMGDTLDMLANFGPARGFIFDGIASTVEYAVPQMDVAPGCAAVASSDNESDDDDDDDDDEDSSDDDDDEDDSEEDDDEDEDDDDDDDDEEEDEDLDDDEGETMNYLPGTKVPADRTGVPGLEKDVSVDISVGRPVLDDSNTGGSDDDDVTSSEEEDDEDAPELTLAACTAMTRVLIRFVLGFYQGDLSLAVPAMLCLEKVYRHQVKLVLEKDDYDGEVTDPVSAVPDKELWQNVAVAVYSVCRSEDKEASRHGTECYRRLMISTKISEVPDDKWIAILYLMVNKQPSLNAENSRGNTFSVLGQIFFRLVPALSDNSDNWDDLADLVTQIASLAAENLREGRRGTVSITFEKTVHTVTSLSNQMMDDSFGGSKEFNTWASETLLAELEKVGAGGGSLKNKAGGTKAVRPSSTPKIITTTRLSSKSTNSSKRKSKGKRRSAKRTTSKKGNKGTRRKKKEELSSSDDSSSSSDA